MSDVYSFGVVLLELLTGRKSVDKSRPQREQSLVEWARPMLNDARKLSRVMDPRLEGQYSETGARKAAALAYQCLSHRPKQRPTMSTVVKTLEPLKDLDEDITIGTFVFTVPTESSNKDNNNKEEDLKECEAKKETRKENCNHRQNHKLHNGIGNGRRRQMRSPKPRPFQSDNGHCRNGSNSPLHPSSKGP